jgi:hypothetical protein
MLPCVGAHRPGTSATMVTDTVTGTPLASGPDRAALRGYFCAVVRLLWAVIVIFKETFPPLYQLPHPHVPTTDQYGSGKMDLISMARERWTFALRIHVHNPIQRQELQRLRSL